MVTAVGFVLFLESRSRTKRLTKSTEAFQLVPVINVLSLASSVFLNKERKRKAQYMLISPGKKHLENSHNFDVHTL